MLIKRLPDNLGRNQLNRHAVHLLRVQEDLCYLCSSCERQQQHRAYLAERYTDHGGHGMPQSGVKLGNGGQLVMLKRILGKLGAATIGKYKLAKRYKGNSCHYEE